MKTKVEILHIEDDEIDAINMERAFNDMWPDALFIRAHNGEHALEILEQFCPSIVLLDLTMPGMDGLDVLSEIKNREGLLGVPVIVCSGSDAPQDIKNSYENHASGYTVKPGTIEGYRDLVSKLKTYWNSSDTLSQSVWL